MYVNQGEKKKKVKETSAKYEGIVRWIREQIEAEELQPGERIESEYQLCDRFGVSRQTVRHAIAVLEKEGMIEKRRGFFLVLFRKSRTRCHAPDMESRFPSPTIL